MTDILNVTPCDDTSSLGFKSRVLIEKIDIHQYEKLLSYLIECDFNKFRTRIKILE